MLLRSAALRLPALLVVVGAFALSTSACLDQPFATNVDLPLQVLQLTPTDGAVDVARNTTVTAVFNLPLVETSLVAGETFKVEDITDRNNPVAVTGSLTYTAPDGDSAPRASFTPAALLPYSTTFRITLTTGIARAGTPAGTLLKETSAIFTTEDPPALSVVSIDPAGGATGVSPTTSIAITFSEPVRCATAQAGITVQETFDNHPSRGAQAGTTVDTAGTITCTEPTVADDTSCNNGACTVTFSPTTSFALSSVVTVSMRGGTRNEGAIESFRATAAGGQLPATVTSSFTILDPPALRVVQTDPGNGAVRAPVDTALTVTFSEAITCASVDPATIDVHETYDARTQARLGVAETTHAVTVSSCLATQLVLAVTGAFELSSTIEVSLPGTIESAIATSRGGQLEDGAGYAWSFTTDDPPVFVVVQTSPGDGNILVPHTDPIVVRFSEAINASTVNATNFVVQRLARAANGDFSVVQEISSACAVAASAAPCTWVVDDDTVTFTPPANLEFNEFYRFVLKTGLASARATDRSGNLPVELSYTFRVVPTPPVEVVSVEPTAGLILTTASFDITFNQEIFAPDVNPASPGVDLFLAEIPDASATPTPATAVAITLAPNAVSSTYTVTPNVPLDTGKTYALVIKGGIDGVRGVVGGSILIADFTKVFLTIGGSLLVSTDPANGDTNVPVTDIVCAVFAVDVQTFIDADPNAFGVFATNDLGGRTKLNGTLSYSGVDVVTGLDDGPGGNTSNKVCFTPTPNTIPCRDNDELLPANTTIAIVVNFTTTIPGSDGGTVVQETRTFTTGGLPQLVDTFYETVPQVNLVGELTTEVPVNGTLVLVFDTDVDPASVAAFHLRNGVGATVASTITVTADEVRIKPNANLAFNTAHTITVDGGVTAGVLFVDDRYLADDLALSFTTSPANAARISPIAGENPLATTVTPIVFDRPMFQPSLNTDTITALDVTPNPDVAVEGAVATAADDLFSAVFNPLPTYTTGDDVTLTVTTGVLDFLGNPLPTATSVRWPSIQGAPAANARIPDPVSSANVSPNTGALAATTNFVLTMPTNNVQKLNNRMLPASFNGNSVQLRQTATCNGVAAHTLTTTNRLTVATTVGGAESITITPNELLKTGCAYTLTLKPKFFSNIHTIGDDAAADIVLNVTGETTAPTLTNGTVTNATGRQSYVATFSEPIDPATLGAAAVKDKNNAAITGTFTTSGNTVVFTPTNAWRSALSPYAIAFPTSVKDLAGNALAATANGTLTVETTAPTAPILTKVGATIVLTFNEPIDPASVRATTFTTANVVAVAGSVLVIDGAAATVVACTTTSGSTIVIDHVGATTGAPLTITVKGGASGVTDLAGNALAADATLTTTAP